MWHLPLLFPAVDLGQATRWSELIYCNHLVLMTVFVQGLWLNTSFIQLWLSLAQHSLLMKRKLAQCLSCIVLLGFFAFLIAFLSACLHPESQCSHPPPKLNSRQYDGVNKHGWCHDTVDYLLCYSLPPSNVLVSRKCASTQPFSRKISTKSLCRCFLCKEMTWLMSPVGSRYKDLMESRTRSMATSKRKMYFGAWYYRFLWGWIFLYYFPVCENLITALFKSDFLEIYAHWSQR